MRLRGGRGHHSSRTEGNHIQQNKQAFNIAVELCPIGTGVRVDHFKKKSPPLGFLVHDMVLDRGSVIFHIRHMVVLLRNLPLTTCRNFRGQNSSPSGFFAKSVRVKVSALALRPRRSVDRRRESVTCQLLGFSLPLADNLLCQNIARSNALSKFLYPRQCPKSSTPQRQRAFDSHTMPLYWSIGVLHLGR
jgi:hypothetical protein